MSTPIPPHDQASPLWRRLITALLLAVWPAGGLTFLLGSAAGEKNLLGRGRHDPGHRHTIHYPRQPEAGGGHHNRGERTRPGTLVGSRPRDNRHNRYSPLGMPVILGRHRPDRCRLQPSGAAGSSPTAGWKRGISLVPARLIVSPGAGLLVFFGSILYHIQNTPLTLARYFFGRLSAICLLLLISLLWR